MDSQLIDACADIAARLRALAVDAEANLAPMERRELVEIALAVEQKGLQARISEKAMRN